MLRSYDAMTATARRHPEGSLVYVIDQTDLYLRVRDGVRQVYVNIHVFCRQRSAGEIEMLRCLRGVFAFSARELYRSAQRGRECSFSSLERRTLPALTYIITLFSV